MVDFYANGPLWRRPKAWVEHHYFAQLPRVCDDQVATDSRPLGFLGLAQSCASGGCISDTCDRARALAQVPDLHLDAHINLEQCNGTVVEASATTTSTPTRRGSLASEGAQRISPYNGMAGSSRLPSGFLRAPSLPSDRSLNVAPRWMHAFGQDAPVGSPTLYQRRAAASATSKQINSYCARSAIMASRPWGGTKL